MSLRWFILDENGEAVGLTDVHTVMRWERVNGHKRLIAYDQIQGADVSTVLLSHAQLANALPFETLIYGGPHDGQTWKWADRKAAEAGHARVVSALETGTDLGGIS